jgi:hypothetical protein
VNGPRYRAAAVGSCLQATVATRPDGTMLLRATEALGAFPERLTDRLEHWATQAPDRTLVARRGADGVWVSIRYAQMLERVQRVGQALVRLGLSPERPLAILSGNDLEHLTLALAAMWVGVPYAPISTAYSTVSKDFGKLRQILDTLTPGAVFASDGATYGPAIAACVTADATVVLSSGELTGRAHVAFGDLLATASGAEAAAAHARVGPDTIAKFLFTSGSTKQPKGVDQHAPHALRQPAADRAVLPPSWPRSRRCWSTGCPGTTPSAATTTSASCSTTAARCTSTTASPRGRHGRDAAQPARDRADDLLQRAQGPRGDRARDGPRRRRCASACSAA